MLEIKKINDIVELDVKGQDDTCKNHSKYGYYSCKFDCQYNDGHTGPYNDPEK